MVLCARYEKGFWSVKGQLIDGERNRFLGAHKTKHDNVTDSKTSSGFFPEAGDWKTRPRYNELTRQAVVFEGWVGGGVASSWN